MAKSKEAGGRAYFERSSAVAVDPAPHDCPVCARTCFSSGGSFEICSFCGWEDDPVQAADPSFAGGANILSQEAARANWQAKEAKK